MSGATEEARTGSGRAGAVGVVLGVLAVAAPAGFLVGAILGEGRADASLGLTLAAVFVLLAAFVVALAWWQTRRRAAKSGLGTARYMKVVRRIRRGEVPDDPAELPAAIDCARRARRSLNLQDGGWVGWLLGGLTLLWFVTGLLKAFDGHYVRAGYNLVLAGLFLVSPLTMRRQRRRLEAVEQALRDRGRPRDHGTGGSSRLSSPSSGVSKGVRGIRAIGRSASGSGLGVTVPKEWQMTTQYTNRPTGQQHHGASQRGASSNVLSIIAIVLGVIGFIILPIVFALAGLVMAIIAKTVRHERLSTVAIVVSAIGLVGGMVLGAVFANM